MSGLGILMRSPDLCQTNTHGFNLQLQVATLMAPVTHSEIVELRQWDYRTKEGPKGIDWGRTAGWLDGFLLEDSTVIGCSDDEIA